MDMKQATYDRLREEAEIARQRERDKQALNDARACMESRRVRRQTNTCDCYCCRLDRATYGRDW